MDKYLHIITHDVPYPGNADLFSSIIFKIKALKSFGVKVHLHCFSSEIGRRSSIEDFCEKVYYYRRKKIIHGLELFMPYTLATRSNIELISRLNNDENPILFEGFQTVLPLLHRILHLKRKILIRSHRSESLYFWDLFKIRHWGIKKIALLLESILYRKVESKITKRFPLSVSTEKLYNFYLKNSSPKPIYLIPGFTGIPASYFQEGKGGFCLYHGDLSNRENEYAAKWLLEHVFNTLEIPFVIAGYGPSKNLEQAAHLRMHTCLVADPGEKEMLDLIKKAQINLLPSFISTGNKSSIIRSLAIGKHVLTNAKGITDNEMKSICAVAKTPQEFSDAVKVLFNKEFERSLFDKREAYLNRLYRDSQSLNDMLKLLY